MRLSIQPGLLIRTRRKDLLKFHVYRLKKTESVGDSNLMSTFAGMKNLVLDILFISLFPLSASAQNDREEVDRQWLRDSLAAATTILAYHPDSVDLRLKKAAWNIQLKQWDYAKDEYDKVLYLQPDNLAALYYRAYVNERLGRYNFARLDYHNLLKVVPGNYEAQLGLALLNEKDRHYTEAMDGLNRLCSQFPDSAEVFAARAGVEKERHMLELAEYDFGEAIKRDPDNTDYLINRVDIRIRLKKMDEAKEDLDALTRMGTARADLQEFYKRLKKK